MNHSQKIKSLFKDTVIFSLGSLGSKLILFLLVPLYTNYLSTDEYGSAEFVITMSQFIIPILSFNIFSSVIRFGLSKEHKREDVLLNSCIIIFISILLSFLIRPLLGLISPISQWKDYLLAYSCANIISSIEFNYLKASNKNMVYALLSILQTLLLAITNVILIAYFKLGIDGYLLANTLSCWVIVIITFFVGKLYKSLQNGKVDVSLLKLMLKYSVPLIINDISWWVIHSSDKFMIQYMLTTSMLGLYTLASKIPSLINVFVVIFSQAWGISSIKEIESDDDSSDFYSKIFNYYQMVSFGASLILISFIKPFMSVYVGKSFLESWRYVPILLISASFLAISSFCGSIYGALKKSINSMITTVLAGVVNILINYIFILKYNVWGALIGTVVAYYIIANLRLLDINRYLKLSIDWVRYSISYIIVLTQAILISLGLNPFIISVLCIIAYLINNYNIIISLIKNSCEIIKRR